jgi:hypothetical protein
MTTDARTRRLRELEAKWREISSRPNRPTGFLICADDLAAVLDTEGDRPAQLPCGCYIAQCPTHRSQARRRTQAAVKRSNDARIGVHCSCGAYWDERTGKRYDAADNIERYHRQKGHELRTVPALPVPPVQP